MADKVSRVQTIEPDPESLRTVDYVQAQSALDSLVGKTVTSAQIEDTRIAVSTSDGLTFFFYGFMGGRSADGVPAGGA